MVVEEIQNRDEHGKVKVNIRNAKTNRRLRVRTRVDDIASKKQILVGKRQAAVAKPGLKRARIEVSQIFYPIDNRNVPNASEQLKLLESTVQRRPNGFRRKRLKVRSPPRPFSVPQLRSQRINHHHVV